MTDSKTAAVTELIIRQNVTLTEEDLRVLSAMKQDDLFLLAAAAYKEGIRLPAPANQQNQCPHGCPEELRCHICHPPASLGVLSGRDEAQRREKEAERQLAEVRQTVKTAINILEEGLSYAMGIALLKQVTKEG